MKTVSFDLNKNTTYSTYSNQEYDRTCIDHVLYRKAYNRLSNGEMNSIFVTLDLYKLYEMPVHKNSIQNNMYYVKKFKW